MKRLSGICIFSLFLLFSLFQPATATTVRMLSDREMVLDSDVILTGEVRSVASTWDDQREMIWTYVEIERDLLIKGRLIESRIVLKQPGGEDWPYGVEVFGQPKFTPGQQVLLYLRAARDGSLHVAHSFMGMFSIVEDSSIGSLRAVRQFDTRRVELRPRFDNQAVTDASLLADYIGSIRSTLEREADEVYRIESERAILPILAEPVEYERKMRSAEGFSPSFAFMSDGIRWMDADSDEPVKFYVNPNNCPVAGGGQAELMRAMDAWSYQSEASVWLVLFGQTNKCGLAVDNQNTISFADCGNQMDSPVNCAGVLARTQVAWNASGTKMVNGKSFKQLIDTDIVFNEGMECYLSNPVNLAEVACHELGHAIGLGHTAVQGAIMQSNAHFDGRDATLTDDDKAGALMIYPKRNQPGAPEISEVKAKGAKKLTISGRNFTASSLILINGKVVKPKKFTRGGQSDSLLYKGNMNGAGMNEACVINSSGRSEMFYF